MANEPKIIWKFTHGYGLLGNATRTKRGIYFGKVKHTKRHWTKYRAVQMALVQFDGNKKVSRVPFHELEFVGENDD